MKNNRSIYLGTILSLVLTLFSISLCVYLFMIMPKVGYIENNVLYESYNETIDLDKKYVSLLTPKKQIIDSIQTSMQALDKRYQVAQTKKEKQGHYYAYAQAKIKLDSMVTLYELTVEEASIEMQQKVWKTLTKRIKEYGDKHRYTIIMGASGKGNLMYAKNADNITSDIIQYANQRYDDLH